MTKQDVIRRISRQTAVDPQTSRSVIEAFFEVVKSAVAQGETIHIRTFGSFGPKRRAAKVVRNILKGTSMHAEAHTIPHFKPSAEFVKQVGQREVAAALSD